MWTVKTLIRLGDAQTDPSLYWAHMPLCWLCHEAAHFTVNSVPVCQTMNHVLVMVIMLLVAWLMIIS